MNRHVPRLVTRTMSSAPKFPIARSPVLNHLLQSVQKLTPLELAGSWDNVGVMIEAPYPIEIEKGKKKQVLCCIDLTTRVANEALSSTSSTVAVLTYHPPIFSGLKSLTLTNPLQTSLLRLSARGIPVLCIHTAADSALSGTNDFIADAFGEGEREAITPSEVTIQGQGGGGEGRIVRLKEALTREEAVGRIKKQLRLKHVQAAWSATGSEKISKIAICAGSGSSVLKGVKADLYLTGEMDHHSILYNNAIGTHLILTNHSASERPWLTPFAPRLQKELNDLAEADEYEVLVSTEDEEPLQVV